MNLQQLKSLVAIYENNSFSAAADKVSLSHSAISLQIRTLEEEFGQKLFDRSTRPAKLTPTGKATALAAQKALKMVNTVKLIGSGLQHRDQISFGVVPTETQHFLPVVLRELQQHQTGLRIRVKSGLSGMLALQVLNLDLDFAILTAPITALPELQVQELVIEPLYVIFPKHIQPDTDEAILSSQPFIAFENMTWMGHQVSARLQARGIQVNEIMEVDSLDAIEKMVREGFGVSIVPQRFLAPPLEEHLNLVPFCTPQETRRLVLIHRAGEEADLPIASIQKIISDRIETRTTPSLS
ncbi:MAG: LysR family transcriptional regulator [Rhodobacteraceae bacterium]|nr:LysR family transcriptional regulator [Paracoccaceae bacterium]